MPGDLVGLRASQQRERGQGAVEYAIAMAVIALAVFVALQVVGTNVTTIWNSLATTVQNASTGS
jgi:Flp pilus assembly pilin Flp